MNNVIKRSLCAITAIMLFAGAAAGCDKSESRSTSVAESSRAVSEYKEDPGASSKGYEVPSGWIASINNGVGEQMSKTFVYWDEAGYKYINITSTTQSWGSTTWVNKYCSEGKCSSKEEVLEAAKEFGSAGFVVLPQDSTKTLTLDDFLKIDF